MVKPIATTGSALTLGRVSMKSKPCRGAGLFSGVKLLDLCKNEGGDCATTVEDLLFQREEHRSELDLGEWEVE